MAKIAKSQKANYKIFDIKTGKYLSNSKKSTWSSLTWVMSAAVDLSGSWSTPIKVKERYAEENIEIHIFPLEEAKKVSYKSLADEAKENLQKKEEEKKRNQESQEKKKLQNLIEQKRKELEELESKLSKSA
jgi:predicted ribosome quality control (RQC) complex YloA/Tae2 family protein